MNNVNSVIFCAIKDYKSHVINDIFAVSNICFTMKGLLHESWWIHFLIQYKLFSHSYAIEYSIGTVFTNILAITLWYNIKMMVEYKNYICQFFKEIRCLHLNCNTLINLVLIHSNNRVLNIEETFNLYTCKYTKEKMHKKRSDCKESLNSCPTHHTQTYVKILYNKSNTQGASKIKS